MLYKEVIAVRSVTQFSLLLQTKLARHQTPTRYFELSQHSVGCMESSDNEHLLSTVKSKCINIGHCAVGGTTDCTSFVLPIIRFASPICQPDSHTTCGTVSSSQNSIFGISTFRDHSNTTISTFRDWFRRNGMRSRG
jgi:hypothetical protein